MSNTYINPEDNEKLKRAIARIEETIPDSEKSCAELEKLKEITVRVDERNRLGKRPDAYIDEEHLIALEWGICRLENLLLDKNSAQFEEDDELTEVMETIYERAVKMQEYHTKP